MGTLQPAPLRLGEGIAGGLGGKKERTGVFGPVRRALRGRTQRAATAEGLCGVRGNTVIRQAISCDICGTEKKQTNHWFVAYDQGGELRISGWNSRNRLRPGSKHLCGQTCLHKLVDDFMDRSITARLALNHVVEVVEEVEVEEVAVAEPRPELRAESKPEPKVESRPAPARVAEPRAKLAARAAQPPAPAILPVDTSLLMQEELDEFESSARLLTPPESVLPKQPAARPAAVELVAVQGRARVEEPVAVIDEAPRFASRNWRAEAWEREREREQRAVHAHREVARRHTN